MTEPIAKIVAHSVGPHDGPIYSVQARYWRSMHAEVLTHRDFSRSSSSSRAVPVKKMLRQVWREPAGPTHWGANRKGMQATEQLTGWRLRLAKLLWKSASRFAAAHSWAMMKIGLHKQVANRVTEPYQFIHTIITGTTWDNFFALRRHPDAQPEMAAIAEAIHAAMATSKPQRLRAGDWHMPYVTSAEVLTYGVEAALQMSTARCARVSYLTHDNEQPKPVDDFQLHDDLVGSQPMHASPAEHAAEVLPTMERHANLSGFRSYRRAVECQALRINGQLRPITFGKGSGKYGNKK